MQLAVADPPTLGRVVAFPDDRRLVAALREVPIKAIGGDIERTVANQRMRKSASSKLVSLTVVNGSIQSSR
jgi:hypothetical protein